MRNFAPLLFIVFSLSSCGPEKTPTSTDDTKAPIESIKIERYSVANGNPDRISLSSYITRQYDDEGNEIKSVYYTTDDQIMMQFVNNYADGLKTRIDWVDGSGNKVKYVKNSYDEDGRLSRSESFGIDGEFQSGFLHRWKEDGKIEEKAPIAENGTFRPNAIYTYNEDEEFELLKEYDENDSLYAVVQWIYTQKDEKGNWIERHWITYDTMNRVEKRIITYRE